MTRNRFGGDAPSWFLDTLGRTVVVPDTLQTVTFWSGTPDDLARVQYDDLRLLTDPTTPVNSVQGLSAGTLPEFEGPDDASVTRMWASTDGGNTGTWIATSSMSKAGASGSYADLENQPTIPSTAADIGAVPTTRTINGHALSADVTLAAADVGAATAAQGAKADSALQPAGLDAATAPLIPSSSGSATAAALAGAFATPGQGTDRGLDLAKIGWVLEKSASGWDAGLVESPAIWWDEITQQWEMVYTGYDAAQTTAGVGHASSTDLVNWTKDAANPILSATGVAGDPDQGGTTGPFILNEDGTYYLFYIGYDGTGYEAGNKRQCLATATSINGPWTRHGAIISPSGTGWRGGAIWHPHVVKVGNTYYDFFNASEATDTTKERIGYATAPSPLGPWTVDDAHSPLIDLGPAGSFDSAKCIDPALYRVGDGWFMAYGGYDGTYTEDGIAFTSASDFPLGWKKHPANPVLTKGGTNQPDNLAAGKPFIVQTTNRQYHFYTGEDQAASERGIMLAVSPSRWAYELAATDEPSTTRTTTSTTLTTMASTTALWGRTGRPHAQMRALIRANPNNTTLTYAVVNGFSATPLYTGTMTGSTWTDAVTPWFDVPEDTTAAVFRCYLQMKSGSSTVTVSLGNTLYEFRWPTI